MGEIEYRDPEPKTRKCEILDDATSGITYKERDDASKRFELGKSVTLWTPKLGLRTVYRLVDWDKIQAGRDPRRED